MPYGYMDSGAIGIAAMPQLITMLYGQLCHMDDDDEDDDDDNDDLVLALELVSELLMHHDK